MNDWCVRASSIQYQNVCFTHVKLYSQLQQNIKTFSLGEKFAINYIKATSILVCVKKKLLMLLIQMANISLLNRNEIAQAKIPLIS